MAAYFYGTILCKLGKHAEAKPWLKIAINSMPNNPEIIYGWANFLKDTGDYTGAKKNYLKAIKTSHHLNDIHRNISEVYFELGDITNAQASLKQHLASSPSDTDGWARLGKMQISQNKLVDATSSARNALKIDKNNDQANFTLGCALILSGDTSAGWEHLKRCCISNLSPLQLSPFLFHLNALPQLTREEITNFHIIISKKMEEAYADYAPKHTNAKHKERKISVGLISGDLLAHPIGFFIESFIKHIDHNKIYLTAYANQTTFDATSEKIKSSCQNWKNISKLSNQELHKTIIEDKIDILIDLSGHTTDNRLAVFAAKAAPIQVTYLGYFATTGLRNIDYILCNNDIIPKEEAHLYSETPWHLPDTHICYSPHNNAPPPVRHIQNSKNITFGCFNRLIKLNDTVLDVWAKILHKTKDSHLLLICKEMNDELSAASLLERFIARDVHPNRITLEGSMSHDDYLAAHNRVDIMLDPFPYNGTTTTMDALWMGVPVLTLHGDRYCAHMTEAVLRQAELHEWIAKDKEDYVRIAVEYATKPQALATLRIELRERLSSSPLLDAPGFAKKFSAALLGMWHKYCDKK